MKKLFVICLGLLFSLSQVYAQGEGDLKSKLNEMNKKFAQMMVENDNEGMFAWYSDDIISMPSYQPMIKGLDALKEAAKKDEESGAKFLSFEVESTEAIDGGQYIIDIGTYKISMELPGMDMPWDDHGKYMNVWEVSDDGSMKLKVETWNTDVNPWMEMEKAGESQEEEMGKQEKREMEEDKEVD